MRGNEAVVETSLASTRSMAGMSTGSTIPRAGVLSTAGAAAGAAHTANASTACGVGFKAAIAGGTAASAAAATAPRVVSIVALPLGADSYRPSLDLGASFLFFGRIHAVAFGEVLADGVCTHGCVLHRKPFVFETRIAFILSVVHSDDAMIPASARNQREKWSRPLTSIAQIYRSNRKYAGRKGNI